MVVKKFVDDPLFVQTNKQNLIILVPFIEPQITFVITLFKCASQY